MARPLVWRPFALDRYCPYQHSRDRAAVVRPLYLRSKRLRTRQSRAVLGLPHPLYLFNLCGFLGLGALAESTVVIAGLTATFVILYPSVIVAEERLLESKFPDFAAYRLNTPALLPKWPAYATPAHWEVDVRAFVRNARDSIWFLLAAVLVEAGDVAHELGVFPSTFPLY
jgi:hypothetical protein